MRFGDENPDMHPETLLKDYMKFHLYSKAYPNFAREKDIQILAANFDLTDNHVKYLLNNCGGDRHLTRVFLTLTFKPHYVCRVKPWSQMPDRERGPVNHGLPKKIPDQQVHREVTQVKAQPQPVYEEEGFIVEVVPDQTKPLTQV
jgi:hypothetical protein